MAPRVVGGGGWVVCRERIGGMKTSPLRRINEFGAVTSKEPPSLTFLRRQASHACETCLRFTGSPPRLGSDATNLTCLSGAGVEVDMAASPEAASTERTLSHHVLAGRGRGRGSAVRGGGGSRVGGGLGVGLAMSRTGHEGGSMKHDDGFGRTEVRQTAGRPKGSGVRNTLQSSTAAQKVGKLEA